MSAGEPVITGSGYRDSLVTDGATNSRLAEAYRMLRTSLMVELGGSDLSNDKLGILVVTSAGRAEGKTTTTANLALVFGQMGRRVAVVDADLRLPSQHVVFGVETEHGLDEAIHRAKVTPDTLGEVAVRVTDCVDLYLPGDFRPPLPSEVLATTGFRTLLSRLRERYDLVIVDTAPVGLVTDAVLVSQKADGVIFVVSSHQKSRREVKRGFAQLEKANARVLGCVLNRVPNANRGSYGDAYYGTAIGTSE